MATPEGIANVAMATFVEHLAKAGCLTEPKPPAPELTVDDAAKLLCRLSQSVRLSEPDVDYEQLLETQAMVDYAWTQASAAGIPPTELSQAHEARRLLLAHHRGTSPTGVVQ